jgi:hypothetical protein
MGDGIAEHYPLKQSPDQSQGMADGHGGVDTSLVKLHLRLFEGKMNHSSS